MNFTSFTILPQSWAPYLQGVLRIMAAAAFMEHGTGKLLGFPALPDRKSVV